MTPVEIAAALAVQAAVLDRLVRQLEAVEAAVSVSASAAEGSANEESVTPVGRGRVSEAALPIERSVARGRVAASVQGSTSVDADEDDAGWTTLVEAEVAALAEAPTIADGDSSGPTRARAARDGQTECSEPMKQAASSLRTTQAEAAPDRWSAPMRPPRGRESSSIARDHATRSSGAPASEEPASARPSPTRDSSEATSEPIASDPGVDRWSRPLRPSVPGRRAPAEPIETTRAPAPMTTTARATPSSASVGPREPLAASMSEAAVGLDLGLAARERESINLPVPLRLPHARELDVAFEPLSRERELDSPRAFDPEPTRPTRARPIDARPIDARPTRARPLEPRRATEHDARREPSLDDELDELARLEERMADVLERVLVEIGVEP